MLNNIFSRKQTSTPNPLSLSVDQAVTLAVEHWRLQTSLGDSASAPERHALRKIADLLKTLEIEAQTLDNLPYDPGMSAHVIDRIADPRAQPGSDIIIETVSPQVLHRGQVIKPADVVVATAPAA